MAVNQRNFLKISGEVAASSLRDGCGTGFQPVKSTSRMDVPQGVKVPPLLSSIRRRGWNPRITKNEPARVFTPYSLVRR